MSTIEGYTNGNFSYHIDINETNCTFLDARLWSHVYTSTVTVYGNTGNPHTISVYSGYSKSTHFTLSAKMLGMIILPDMM